MDGLSNWHSRRPFSDLFAGLPSRMSAEFEVAVLTTQHVEIYPESTG
jgi:hypothetical protein